MNTINRTKQPTIVRTVPSKIAANHPDAERSLLAFIGFGSYQASPAHMQAKTGC